MPGLADGGGLAAIAGLLAVGAAGLIWCLASLLFWDADGPGVSSGALEAKAQRDYGQLPLRFEANRGQTDSQVDFLARGAGYALFLTPRESVLSLSKPGAGGKADHGKSAVLRMRLVGGNASAHASGIARLSGETNYLRGARSQRGVPGFAKVRYDDVYPGVDLVHYGKQGRLEYDFRVSPRADPSRIALDFSGHRGLSLDRQGNLDIETRAGTVRHQRPVVYQTIAGKRRSVDASFVLRRGDRVGFRLGAYDRSRPLVIDPVVVYSTYLGGLVSEAGHGIDVDASGGAYITGSTVSPNFPMSNPVRGGPNQEQDAFVTKLNPAGSALVYSTYLGGSAGEFGRSIAVDSGGAAYVVGQTTSTDFPTTAGAADTTCGGCGGGDGEAFVTRLTPSGSSLSYSSFLGGAGSEEALAVAVDASASAYVTGWTSSADYPTTPGAFDTTLDPGGGGFTSDTFVTKVNATGTGFAYSTYLGGSDLSESATDIALDSTGNAYVTGNTSSANFPTTPGAYAESCSGAPDCSNDAFVSKLNAAGSALLYSTFLGGSSHDFAHAIALGRGGADDGHIYVAGVTDSGDFPTTGGVVDQENSGCCGDMFVVKFSEDASALDYATFLGGESAEGPGSEAKMGMEVGAAGNAYIAARVERIEDFPIVRPATETRTGGLGIALNLNSDATAIRWSTALGGNTFSEATDIALDSSEAAYVTGVTASTDFPTQNPIQANNASNQFFGFNEAFAMKIAPDNPATPYVTGVSPEGDDASGGRAVTITGTGFANAISVKFGGVEASRFDVVSPTEIHAIAPPHPEADTRVTVTDSDGTSPPNPVARFVYAEGRWARTDEAQVSGSAALLKNGKVLVVGESAAALFDPKGATWTPAADPPVAPGGTPTLLRSGEVLIVGDGAAAVYDPATDSWTPTQDTPTQGGGGILLPDGRVLTVGGSAAEIYDPASDSFTPTDPPPHDYNPGTLLLNGKVLFTPREPDVDAALWDPATGNWTDTGGFNIDRRNFAQALLPNGKVLVVGGFDAASFFTMLDSAEVYDPATGQWSLTGRMQNGVRWWPGPGGAVLLPNGKVLIAGGQAACCEVRLDTAELFDPAIGSNGGFKSAGRMEAGVPNPVMVVLSSSAPGFAFDPAVCGSNCGKVLVVNDSGEEQLYTPRRAPAATGGGGGGAGGRYSAPGRTLAGCPAPRSARNLISLTAGGDRRNGTPGADLIFAGAGNDVIDALAGDDCVDLGPGTDRGQGGSGGDFLLGGLGRDALSGSSGSDRMRGDESNDRLSGNSGNDRILGGTGLDVIFGGFGNDRLHGQSASDQISGSRGRDRINGGSGRDRISGGSSRDVIRGDAGNDRISGDSSRDVLRGNSGNDRISAAGDGARDRISCGSGRDRVVADANDVVADDCERVRRR